MINSPCFRNKINKKLDSNINYEEENEDRVKIKNRILTSSKNKLVSINRPFFLFSFVSVYRGKKMTMTVKRIYHGIKIINKKDINTYKLALPS